ncbi:MAG: transcriptional regulator [Myxococcales bacterium]
MRNLIPAMLPDIETLRCFVAAARTLHFKTAASHVMLSPSALSARVRALEELVGVPLFDRTTRTVRLTPAGEALLPHAQRCLEEARACIEAVVEVDESLPFALTVGTRFELGMSWVLPELKRMREQRPERLLDLYFGDSADLLERVRSGRIDAMISSVRLTLGDLRYAPLHEERYVFVGEPGLIADRPLTEPEHAMAHVLLDAHPDLPLFRYFLDAAPVSDVWAFRGAEHLGTIAAVRYRLLEGAGVAVLPRYFVEPDLAAGRLVPLVEHVEPHRDFFRLIWRGSHPMEHELQLLAAELRSVPLR